MLTPTAAEIPTKVERHNRWPGQIRWDKLIPRLSALAPADPVVDAEWKRLLAVVGEPGDLADEAVGWQLGRHKVGARNRLVLSAVTDRATSTVGVELARRAGRSTSDGLCGINPRSRARSVVISGDRAKLALFVPAPTKRGPVIEIDLVGTRRPLKLTTYVNPGLPPFVRGRAAYDKTLTRLRKEGFVEQASGTHEGWYAAHDAIAPTDDAASPQEALWTVLEGRLKAIVGSGRWTRSCRNGAGGSPRSSGVAARRAP